MCKTITREDIHCPRNFRADRYEFVGVWAFVEPQCIEEIHELLLVRKHVKELFSNGWRWADHHRGSQCDICGAYHIYSFVLACDETKELIRIGGDCAMKFEAGGDFNALANVRRAVSDWRQLKAGKTKAHAMLAEAGLDADFALQFVHVPGDGHQPWLEGFVAGLGVDIEKEGRNPELNTVHKIRDIVNTIIRTGRLSEKQSSFLGSLLEQAKDFAGSKARREAKFAAIKQSSVHVGQVGDKIELEGTVTFQRDCEGHYGSYQLISIDCGEGRKIFTRFTGGRQFEKGEEIRFKATVKDHTEDPRYGKSTVVNRIKVVE